MRTMDVHETETFEQDVQKKRTEKVGSGFRLKSTKRADLDKCPMGAGKGEDRDPEDD